MLDNEPPEAHFARHGKLEVRPKRPRRSRAASHLCNVLAIREALEADPETRDLVLFDEFRKRIILRQPVPRPGKAAPKGFVPRPWQDRDATALTEHLIAQGFTRCTPTRVEPVIALIARDRTIHPVREYLNGCRWDGTERLSTWLKSYANAHPLGEQQGSEDQAGAKYLEAAGRASLIAAVARIMQPGCKVDTMLVLQGAQGAHKSALLRSLCPDPEWFSDNLPRDVGSKDASEHLAGVWIIESSEVAALKRSQGEDLKAFLSRRVDRYRPAYGRNVEDHPRQCVLFGTTNEDCFLQDDTGNRRFWPVAVGRCDVNGLIVIRDQLWAEAVTAYKGGELWHLTAEMEDVAAAEQEARRLEDPLLDKVAKVVIGMEHVQLAEILEALAFPVTSVQSVGQRVAKCLRELGWQRQRALSDSQRSRRWFPPEAKLDA